MKLRRSDYRKTKDYTHYLVLNVKDLKALLSMSEKAASQITPMGDRWKPDMHTVVMRFNENQNYEGQLNVAHVASGVAKKTMYEIRRGDF